MKDRNQNKHYSEPVEIEENSTDNLMKKIIIISSILVSLPIYFLFLFLIDDSLFTDSAMNSSSHSKGRAKKVKVSALGEMNFAPQKLKQITSTEELLKSLLLTVDDQVDSPQKSMYLRVGSVEAYTNTAMTSIFNMQREDSWPEFALEKQPKDLFANPPKTCLNFFCNFEERLPYPPVLKRLAGTLNFCPMGDGSVLLDHTIAVGDEFEIEFTDSMNFLPENGFAPVNKSSPYLDLYPLNVYKITALANTIAPANGDAIETESASNTIFLLANFLEQNGVYKPDFVYKTNQHPVEEFLLKKMEGHCQHFAASFVALCRAKGIPARVGTGFYTNVKNDGKFLVTENMAHAWPEILTNDGWKIFDISAQKSDMPKTVATNIEIPSSRQLNELNRQLTEKNQAEAKNDESARNETRNGENKSFDRPENPGTLVKNKDKERAFLQKQKKSNHKKIIKILLILLLTAVLCWLSWKYADRFFLWLVKWLKKAFARNHEEPEEEDLTRKTEELINFINEATEANLMGKDLVELFQRFTQLMDEKGHLPRGEHETPAEYFTRLCETLGVKPQEGKKAATFFEAELYGQNKTSAEHFKQFISLLKLLIGHLR